MSNPNKIHYPRGYTSLGGIQFNPKFVVGCILVLFSLYAVYKYGQFAAEKNFNMSGSETRGSPRVEFLSWQPRVFYHHNFLTDSEISYLTDGNLNMTAGSIKPFTGNGKWFEDILARLARFTQEPIANFEQGFFSKYDPGHDTEPRRDWFKADETDLKGAKGNRVATIIMFVTPAGKGEISFPKANLKVTPNLGDALLVWNLAPDHTIDENAIYGFQKISQNPMLTYTIYIREKAG
jgi:hypothetical protein